MEAEQMIPILEKALYHMRHVPPDCRTASYDKDSENLFKVISFLRPRPADNKEESKQ